MTRRHTDHSICQFTEVFREDEDEVEELRSGRK